MKNSLISLLAGLIGAAIPAILNYLGTRHNSQAEVSESMIENAPNFWKRIDTLENERDEARSAMNSLQHKVDMLTNTNQELIRQNDNLKKQNSKILKENADLRQRIDKLTKLTEKILYKEENNDKN